MKKKEQYKWHFYTPLYWRLLRKSGVFKYWFRDFLTELLYNLEIWDIEPNEMKEKYLKKYKKYV